MGAMGAALFCPRLFWRNDMKMNMESAALFCAARCTAAKEAMEMASKSTNHDFVAAWDSPGNSAFWWESFNGNDTRKARVAA